MAEQEDVKVKFCPNCQKEYTGGEEKCTEDGALLQERSGSADYSLIGQVFADKYEIIGVLGEGGMSIVYKARHRYMDRLVAVKLLHEHLVNDKSAVARFEHESKASSSLSHQNIVTVHDFGMTKNGQAYFVMDCLDGHSLSEILEKQGTVPLSEAIQIFKQTCDGLEHAHKKRVVHRDLKPSNLVLMKNEDGSMLVKIVDFGIAKLLPVDGVSRQNITVTGEIFGSPLYMSPEQCNGKSLDQRSDIYSLGCLMYETLSGVPPIIGDSFVNTVVKHINEAPPPFSQTAPDAQIPPQVEACIMKCLAKNPEDRYQSAAEVRQSLLDAALEAGVKGLRAGAVAVTAKRSNFLSQTFERVKLGESQQAGAVKSQTRPNRNLMVVGIGTLLLLTGAIVTLALWPGPQGDRGPGYLRLLWSLQLNQAQEAMKAGRYEEAKGVLAEAKKTALAFEDKHKRLLDTLAVQAENFGKVGMYAEQEACNQEIITLNSELVLEEVAHCEQMLSSLKKESSSSVSRTMNQLEAEANADTVLMCSKKLMTRSMFSEAEKLLKHAIATFDHLNLDNHQKTADFKMILAECLLLRQKLSEVRPLLVDAVRIREQTPDLQNPLAVKHLVRARLRLGQFDRDQSNYKDAKEEMDKALDLAKTKLPHDKDLMAEAYNSYADLMRQMGDAASATKYRELAETAAQNVVLQAKDSTKEATVK